MTVKVVDNQDHVIRGFTGEVLLSSSDPQALLPKSYHFTAADEGVHTFHSVVLKTAGVQWVEASAPGSAAPLKLVSQAHKTTVLPGPAVQLSLAKLAPAAQDAAQDAVQTVTVTAVDAFGNVVPDYASTVHFVSSDLQAVLPKDYTFTAYDGGQHTFTVVFNSAGTEQLSVVDTEQPHACWP